MLKQLRYDYKRIKNIRRSIDSEGSRRYMADDLQNNGLGLKLNDILIGIGVEKGLKSIFGIVLNDNQKMIGLSRKLGFAMERISEDESRITLELQFLY